MQWWLGIFLLVVSFLVPVPLRASESELEDAPPPKNVTEIDGRVEREFKPPSEPERPVLVPDAVADLPSFLRDATYRVRLRSRYLNRRKFDDDRTETWAGGGSLLFRSGWWRDAAAVELEYFTSQKLKGDPDRDGARYLEPGQHGFGVLGIANLKLRHEQWSLTAYRQELNLPYLNGNDSRMVPNTFEAVTARYAGDNVAFLGGYTSRVKLRDSDEFQSFPESQGVDKDRGISFLAFKFNPTPATNAGLFGYYGADVASVLYAEGSWLREVTANGVIRLEGQFTHGGSTGDALLNGGEDFTTWFAGARASASVGTWLVSLAATHTDDGGDVQSQFGSNPSYLDRMQHSFTRANEDALGVSLSYDFAERDLPGLSAAGNVTQGWGGENDAGARSDRLESALTIDWRPPEGPLSGLWVRLRGSVLYDDEEDRTQNEVRIEIQHDFDLF